MDLAWVPLIFVKSEMQHPTRGICVSHAWVTLAITHAFTPLSCQISCNLGEMMTADTVGQLDENVVSHKLKQDYDDANS